VLSADEMRQQLNSIGTSELIGLRDRAMLACRSDTRVHRMNAGLFGSYIEIPANS
jgi:hypothetical protein